MSAFSLFDFQRQALDIERAHRIAHLDETRLAVVLPTGTGKTVTFAAKACEFLDSFEGAGSRVLILVHTDELAMQAEATVRYVAGQLPALNCGGATFSVGVVKAERDEYGADIVIASVQTLARAERRERLRDVGLVIVDECHHAVADTYQTILRHFGCMPKCTCTPYCAGGDGPERDCPEHGSRPVIPALGFTATLERADGQGLGTVWQNVVFTRDISWAVRKGYLVQPIGYRLEIELPHPAESGLAPIFYNDPTALDTQIADSIAPARIVEKWTELAKGRQTIVFAPLVRSANTIRDAFRIAGIKAETVHGAMPDELRRHYVKHFKAGNIDVLCNAMVLTEGFDHPNVGCVIVARPTKSRSLFIQMAGRGLRRRPGIPVEEQDCILITLADTTTDICSIADLSDRPLDHTADGPLTVMEDQFDIGKHLDEQSRHWAGQVSATAFDPIVARSSKVWSKTRSGHWFLPISDQREYVFILDVSIYVLTRKPGLRAFTVSKIHAGLPDLEFAMRVAEDEATERGGDLGALLADRTRPWRRNKPKPNDRMMYRARQLGLSDEVDRIMMSAGGGKAGKISDLIRRVEASLSIDKAVQMINSSKATA